MVNYIFAEFAFVSAFRDNSGFGLNILGPLFLWQCLFRNLRIYLPPHHLGIIDEEHIKTEKN